MTIESWSDKHSVAYGMKVVCNHACTLMMLAAPAASAAAAAAAVWIVIAFRCLKVQQVVMISRAATEALGVCARCVHAVHVKVAGRKRWQRGELAQTP